MSATMGLLNPWGAVALLAVGVLIALHLWDRRRRVVPVSALLLWRRLPAAPLERRRRLRADPLLLAQIAAVLCLIASLVRPWIAGAPAAVAAASRILVLDVSASMQTREAGGTRFELARRRADAFVSADGETMLVVAAGRPRVVVRWTTDALLVRRSLETLEPLDVAAHLDTALALAVAEARARPGARVAVLTDDPRAASGLASDDLARIDWVQLGHAGDNVGIVALTVDAPAFGSFDDGAAIVTVRNFAAAPRTVRLTARVGDVPWAERAVALEARGAASVRFARPPAPGVVVVTLDARDALAADDVARAWLPAHPPLDLVVVSDGGRLPAVVADVVHGIARARVATMTAAEYAAAPPAGAGRVVVFDGVAPDAAPGSSALYVAPPVGNARCAVAARVRGAAVVDWEPAHPLLAGLDSLASLVVTGASALGDVPWGNAVAYAASNERAFPFLVAGVVAGRRSACLAAGPSGPAASTDQLPLVLLTLATIGWLQEDAGAAPVVVRTGAVVASPVAADAPVSGPGLRLAGDPPVLVAERAGVFRVGAPGAERLVLASLLDARESDVGRDGDGDAPATGPPPAAAPAPSVREIGRPLAAAGAALLALEWALWVRRRA